MADPMSDRARREIEEHVKNIRATYSDLRNAAPNLRRIVRMWDEMERLREEAEASDQATAERGDQAREYKARLDKMTRWAYDVDARRMAAERDRDAARAEVKRLRKELTEASEVLTVTGEKLTAVRGQRDRAEAERDRLAGQVKRARARHTGVCSGACGLDDACECEDRDLICAEDNDRWPCPTRRDLDGTEAGQ